MTGYLNATQVEALLKPINPSRVLSLKKGDRGPALSYVAQHDIRAHLNRIFGFGRWSMRVIETEFLFEQQNEAKRWVVGYRATVGLDIKAPDGTLLATYEDSHASSNAPQPDRGEAHALALTIATSTAMKRAAACLGDQFGLSLYNKGQTLPFVKGTLIGVSDATEVPDAEVTSMGDEVSERTVVEEAEEPLKIEQPPVVEVPVEFLERLREAIPQETHARLQTLVTLKQEAVSNGWSDDVIINRDSGMTLGKVFDLVAKGGK